MATLSEATKANSISAGATCLFRAPDALKALVELKQQEAVFLGSDGFVLLPNGGRQSSLEMILDVSREAALSMEERYTAAEAFIRRHAAVNTAFELVWD